MATPKTNCDETQRPSDFKDRADFQLAAAHAHDLASQGFSMSIFAALLLFGALIANTFSLNAIWIAFFCNNAAALVLFGAGLRSAYDVVQWRQQKAGLPSRPLARPMRWFVAFVSSPWSFPNTEEPDRFERWTGSALSVGQALFLRIGARPLWVFGLSLLACLIVSSDWTLTTDDITIGTPAFLIVAACLAFAFFLLVTERRLAAIDAEEWPEASTISQLARVPIFVLVMSCFCLFLSARGSGLSVKLLAALGGFIALVGLEFLLRAIVSMFRPQNNNREPSLITNSLVANLLQWPPQPWIGIQTELRTRHGIDLRQIWAFSFIRKAAPAIVLGTIVLGWLLSGVREIPMTGRGVYERFGKAEAILHSGLHIGLPWPFGRVVLLDNGSVHELATSVSTADGNEPPTNAEGPAPESANRLWDASHISEKSQVIASGTGGKQSFQIVNMDVRFVYRIGLSDRAAMKAAYRVADLPGLIESTANRVLVHDFAKRTLNDVLSEGRLSLANDIASAVQKNMDELNSGIEILAVIIEAIHPPAGAANAFHGVQAAQIGAETLVARERGTAAEQTNEAQLNASLRQDSATAAARENIAASQVAKLRFQADQSAYRLAGQAFLTEEYFNQLTMGLSRAKALVLDHRIGASIAPTFDLRNMILPVDPDTNQDTRAKPSTPYQSEETSP
ncbi:protease modulator HflK (plasmid) [Rhizobium sp. T1470]|uniref:protease modulator HflK n=1 Tax=unclassified Rhizobium TaxID=2613769 RepID=UPI001AAE4FF9|nr:protease modulator HflK [Rhizobium sp. T1473]MCA0805553.1 protease modulator HflK [Rhizobium sp. T1473]